jgi:hypothetical protein
MGSKRKTERTYSVDDLMARMSSYLVRDFQDNLNDHTFCSGFLSALNTLNPREIREAVPGVDMHIDQDTYKFKCEYQLHSILKRHRFQKDIYSEEELQEKAISTFLETQLRLQSLDLESVSAKTKRILDWAACYVSKVLGPYSDEEHRDLCRFGRRASVGIPARAASLAARWEIPISGSQEQIEWFDSEMSHIDCVRNYLHKQLESDPQGSIYLPTSSLTLALVPKTFKSLRAIMPNTTIGSYMSFGLGEIIRKRLKREGYDIRTLQERHKYLARIASTIPNGYATCDLSSASDSISVALVRRLFPDDWFEILERSRIGTVLLPNAHSVESLTFCTMGIGYTFPLQTLVFLALLKAIQALSYDRLDSRLISVYGDDMIYASRMHEQVASCFKELGFVINDEKSFVTGHFRESCGGDYYRGVDVRPFQPRNGATIVSQKAYEATLYKCVNGLLRRWHECEIVRTLSFLTSEIEKATNACKRVPASYPDDSGIRCPNPDSWDFLKSARVASLKSVGHGLFRFSYLSLKSQTRKEMRHEPYLWEALRDKFDTPRYYRGYRVDLPASSPDYLSSQIDDRLRVEKYVPQLVTQDVEPIQLIRSFTGKRLRRTATFVTVSHTGRYTRQSGVSCFETRR